MDVDGWRYRREPWIRRQGGSRRQRRSGCVLRLRMRELEPEGRHLQARRRIYTEFEPIASAARLFGPNAISRASRCRAWLKKWTSMSLWRRDRSQCAVARIPRVTILSASTSRRSASYRRWRITSKRSARSPKRIAMRSDASPYDGYHGFTRVS